MKRRLCIIFDTQVDFGKLSEIDRAVNLLRVNVRASVMFPLKI